MSTPLLPSLSKSWNGFYRVHRVSSGPKFRSFQSGLGQEKDDFTVTTVGKGGTTGLQLLREVF